MLSPENDEQLANYLRFLRRKRDAAIAEVAAEFKEVKETRLIDDNYTIDDVDSILDSLLTSAPCFPTAQPCTRTERVDPRLAPFAVTRTSMKRDLQNISFSSVLLLKQVLEQTEAAQVPVSTDIPSTEDIGLMRAVEEWDQSVHGGGAPPPLRARAAMDNRGASGRALPRVVQTQVRSLAWPCTAWRRVPARGRAAGKHPWARTRARGHACSRVSVIASHWLHVHSLRPHSRSHRVPLAAACLSWLPTCGRSANPLSPPSTGVAFTGPPAARRLAKHAR